MSPRITPLSWKILEKIFILDGFVYKRTRGDHRLYEKPGVIRPIVIPMYDEVDDDIIHTNMRTAGMSRDRYFELLKKVK
ncbi:MAG: type II toxin-antitoxin system HicA family toxin [Smithellaceae bacterium]|jgi:predicted RNA binding protein YcfA (HicA-like mRNA interferase family)